MNMNQLTIKSQEALQAAQQLAQESGHQFIENLSIPVNLRSNSGFDLDLNIFNELRIGVGYKLSRE